MNTESPVSRFRFPILVALLLLLLAGCSRSPGPAVPEPTPTAPTVRTRTLLDAVANARAGDTIILPAGVFDAGIARPTQVSLRGAGLGQTILDAHQQEIGLSVDGGEGDEIADQPARAEPPRRL